jgi:hypothetical protein
MWLIALKGLASNGKSTLVRFTISTENKQATGTKNYCAKCNTIATYFYGYTPRVSVASATRATASKYAPTRRFVSCSSAFARDAR